MDHEIINFGLSAMPTGPIINVISNSPRLAKISKMVVLYGKAEELILAIYRESSDAPGKYSRKEYKFLNGVQVGKVKKDIEKYETPTVPAGAIKQQLLGNQFYSVERLNSETRKLLREFIKTNIKP